MHSENGEEKTDDPEESKEIFSGHLSNMGRLAKEGKLVVAGLFEDGAPKRGLFIFNVTTLKGAKEIVNTVPVAMAGVFGYELTKLYRSALKPLSGLASRKRPQNGPFIALTSKGALRWCRFRGSRTPEHRKERQSRNEKTPRNSSFPELDTAKSYPTRTRT